LCLRAPAQATPFFLIRQDPFSILPIASKGSCDHGHLSRRAGHL
jgi:hypothetical protein